MGSWTIGHIVINTHWEWIRFLENHAHPSSKVNDIYIIININAIQLDFTVDFSAFNKVIHTV